MPTPELSRDEFNAYRVTILQEYLYELIFKESNSTASSSFNSMGELPVFEEDQCNELNEQFQMLASAIPNLIEDVKAV